MLTATQRQTSFTKVNLIVRSKKKKIEKINESRYGKKEKISTSKKSTVNQDNYKEAPLLKKIKVKKCGYFNTINMKIGF